MSYSFIKLCERIAASVNNMPIHWTSIWETAEPPLSVITTTGDIWATGVLTFNDKNLFPDTREIGSLPRETVVEVGIERTLTGLRLKVVTRYLP